MVGCWYVGICWIEFGFDIYVEVVFFYVLLKKGQQYGVCGVLLGIVVGKFEYLLVIQFEDQRCVDSGVLVGIEVGVDYVGFLG